MSYEIDELHQQKDSKLSSTVQLQTRAKWYRAIKDKKYRLVARDEDKVKNELFTIKSQNEDLRETVEKLEAEFPYLSSGLKKITNIILVPTPSMDASEEAI